MAQGRYWMITIPIDKWDIPEVLPKELKYLKGQQEVGESGYVHWQLMAACETKMRLNALKRLFCEQAHCELTRSSAASEYVWKDDTAIEGTRFELGKLITNAGQRAYKRNSKTDYAKIVNLAEEGKLEEIKACAPDVYLRHFNTLKRIEVENCVPVARGNPVVHCYWGDSGTGKTYRAFQEAGDPNEYYIKNPNTKWWDGYKGQLKVIVDEFTGQFAWNHFTRWCDGYPCTVEVKGGQVVLKAIEFWFTSNVDPRDWYQGNEEQKKAVLRRLNHRVHFQNFPNVGTLTRDD